MATTNFLQWNPSAINQKNDAGYVADSQRTGGIGSGQLDPSQTDNKFRFQVTTFIAAFCQALVAKGYTTSDAVLATLVTVLGNIMTQADMSIYALLASPAFTGNPTCPTQAVGDATTKLANTLFCTPAISKTSNGYVKLPSGLIIQWCQGSAINANTPAGSGALDQTVSWPLQFPTICLWAGVSTRIFTGGGNFDGMWQTVGAPDRNGQEIYWQQINTLLDPSPVVPYLLAIGY